MHLDILHRRETGEAGLHVVCYGLDREYKLRLRPIVARGC